MSSSSPTRFRFAPSPTGALHIGGARTALYNWLLARGSGGELVLRIEDTDRERSTTENVDLILEALGWLEIDWDVGPVSQFERRERHAARLAELLEGGHAYHDPATAADVRAWKEANKGVGYRGEPRPEPGAAIRLRVPDEGATVVEDLIHGEVRFENRTQDDFVIARGDGTPLYNLAVAVDDAETEITDVVRGDDHLSNTPKQLLVLGALGATPASLRPPPAPPRTRRAKAVQARTTPRRCRSSTRVGYLPAAVRNYLALLGWGTDDDTTILSTDELIERFSIERVGRSAAIFDQRKLRWMNGRYMRALTVAEYERRLREPPSARLSLGRRALSVARRPSAERRPVASCRTRRRRWARSGR